MAIAQLQLNQPKRLAIAIAPLGRISQFPELPDNPLNPDIHGPGQQAKTNPRILENHLFASYGPHWH